MPNEIAPVEFALYTETDCTPHPPIVIVPVHRIFRASNLSNYENLIIIATKHNWKKKIKLNPFCKA